MNESTFGERVREVRKDAGLTQTEFAARLGIQMNAVYMVESGRRGMSPATIRELCRKFSINETWLSTGEGSMHYDLAPALDAADRVRRLMVDYPHSTAASVISALLALDPSGPEWETIESLLAAFSENKKSPEA